MSSFYPQVIGNTTEPRLAWAVFTDKTDIPYLHALKRGFRHCFVIINDGQRWYSVDPLSNHTEIEIHHHIDKNFDLPDWLRQRNHTVVETKINRTQSKSAPLGVFSCVEAVKRILGIHNFFIQTPYQLHNHLVKG